MSLEWCMAGLRSMKVNWKQFTMARTVKLETFFLIISICRWTSLCSCANYFLPALNRVTLSFLLGLCSSSSIIIISRNKGWTPDPIKCINNSPIYCYLLTSHEPTSRSSRLSKAQQLLQGWSSVAAAGRKCWGSAIALCIFCHVLVKDKEKIEQPKKRSVDDTRQDTTTTGWISHSRKLQVISYEFPVLPVSGIWIWWNICDVHLSTFAQIM